MMVYIRDPYEYFLENVYELYNIYNPVNLLASLTAKNYIK